MPVPLVGSPLLPEKPRKLRVGLTLRPRRLAPDGREFFRQACAIAFANVEIIACDHCGRPVERGYVCMACLSDTPDVGQEPWSPS